MARTESASQLMRRRRRSASIRTLVTWTLYQRQFGETPTTLTVRISDRTFEDVSAGVEFAPLVTSWGPITSRGAERAPVGSPDTFEFTMAPRPVPGTDAARLLDLLRRGRKSDGYDAGLGRVVVECLDDGLAYTEAYKVGGPWVVDDIRPADDGGVVVRLTSEESLLDVNLDALTPALIEPGESAGADWVTYAAVGQLFENVADSSEAQTISDYTGVPLPFSFATERLLVGACGHAFTALPLWPQDSTFTRFMAFVRNVTALPGTTLRVVVPSGINGVAVLGGTSPHDTEIVGVATLTIYRVTPPTSLAEMDTWTPYSNFPTIEATVGTITAAGTYDYTIGAAQAFVFVIGPEPTGPNATRLLSTGGGTVTFL